MAGEVRVLLCLLVSLLLLLILLVLMLLRKGFLLRPGAGPAIGPGDDVRLGADVGARGMVALLRASGVRLLREGSGFEVWMKFAGDWSERGISGD